MGSEKVLNTAAEFVRKGGVVIIPTDTIYGFSCDPNCENAVDRIYEIKKRENKPYIILDSNPVRVRSIYFKDDEFLNQVISIMMNGQLWPGRITIIADKKEDLHFSFLKEHKKIAVRFTDNETVNYICTRLGSGIVSTSINLSGEKYLNDIEKIRAVWTESVDFIVESETEGDHSSSIIEVMREEKNLKVIRTEYSEEKNKIIEIFLKKGIKCH